MESNLNKYTVSLYLAVGGILSGCVTTQSGSPSGQVPLVQVIQKVNGAIDEYQSQRGSGAQKELPPLASAEFDFKTVTSSTVGGTLNILVLKLGTTRETDITNDVTYTYALPKPEKPAVALQSEESPPDLKDALAHAIQEAAAAVKSAATAAGLPFSKLTINIQYGVKIDGSVGAAVPVSIVTIGPTVDANRNTVQSVKLTFGDSSGS
jgi:hypothetical protein